MLIAKDLTVSIKDKTIISNFNCNLELNKIHCIIGSSGAGKTTLLRTIAGLQKPTKGTITLDKTLIVKPSKDIFMMHQHYSNFDWLTCLENVLIANINNKKRVKQLEKDKAIDMLEQVGLKDYINKYPSELSGGMNQRLALARTLIANPKIILMDEPLSALDKNTRSQMQKLILSYQKINKNTILMITHSQSEAYKMGNSIITITKQERND